MTRTAEIVERLRKQHLHHCFQIDREAADHIESLARERDRAVEALRRIANAPYGAGAKSLRAIARADLAQIDTESEGER